MGVEALDASRKGPDCYSAEGIRVCVVNDRGDEHHILLSAGAPGTAVDAYSSLSTPKEDIAQLRQELGFTIVEPLHTLSGMTDVLEGLSLVGAYEGVDELEVRLTVSTPPESASYIVEWSSAGKSSPQSAILKVGDELVLPDGFRLKAEKLIRLESPRELRFSALSLDNKPFRAFYEWLAKVMVGDFGQSQVISQNSAVMGIAGSRLCQNFITLVRCTHRLHAYRKRSNHLETEGTTDRKICSIAFNRRGCPIVCSRFVRHVSRKSSRLLLLESCHLRTSRLVARAEGAGRRICTRANAICRINDLAGRWSLC